MAMKNATRDYDNFYCVSCAYKSYLKIFDFQSLRIISILIYTFIVVAWNFCNINENNKKSNTDLYVKEVTNNAKLEESKKLQQ